MLNLKPILLSKLHLTCRFLGKNEFKMISARSRVMARCLAGFSHPPSRPANSLNRSEPQLLGYLCPSRVKAQVVLTGGMTG